MAFLDLNYSFAVCNFCAPLVVLPWSSKRLGGVYNISIQNFLKSFKSWYSTHNTIYDIFLIIIQPLDKS